MYASDKNQDYSDCQKLISEKTLRPRISSAAGVRNNQVNGFICAITFGNCYKESIQDYLIDLIPCTQHTNIDQTKTTSNTMKTYPYFGTILACTLGISLFFSHTTQAAKFGFGLKKKPGMDEQIKETKARFAEKDAGIEKLFKNSVGYAIFPKIYKAGIGFGGAIGKGRVYQGGKHIGDTSLKQATVGFQLGGQAYSEVIFFHDQDALDAFKSGNFEFGAQVSAVAATAGASDDASFDQGMMVFTVEIGGLMYEATVGGQKFSYKNVK